MVADQRYAQRLVSRRLCDFACSDNRDLISNTKWLYIPLTVVLLLATSVQAVHNFEMGNRDRIALRRANLPFGYDVR